MPFTTLIVDDEPLAREGLRMLLSQDPEVSAISEARDGREAIAAMFRCQRWTDSRSCGKLEQSACPHLSS